MVIVLVPMPSIFAPRVCRHSARSTISGSCAQFASAVVPRASTAALSTFSVAPTLTMSNTKRPPFRRSQRALTKPFSTVTSAPSACMPRMCRSTGREPMAQPPGSDTSAWPNLANSGPSTRIEARMVLTSSYGATVRFMLRGSLCRVWLSSTVILAPSAPSRLMVVVTSCRCGTFDSVTGSSARMVAHRIGSTAFLAPEICTSPFSTSPPLRMILAMSGSSAAAGFGRRQGLQGQGVDFAAHLVAQGGVHQAVAGQRQLALESLVDDQGLEMHAVVAVDLDMGAGQAGKDHLGYGFRGHPHTVSA